MNRRNHMLQQYQPTPISKVLDDLFSRRQAPDRIQVLRARCPETGLRVGQVFIWDQAKLGYIPADGRQEPILLGGEVRRGLGLYYAPAPAEQLALIA